MKWEVYSTGYLQGVCHVERLEELRKSGRDLGDGIGDVPDRRLDGDCTRPAHGYDP